MTRKHKNMLEGIWGKETSAFSQKVPFVKKIESHTLNAKGI